MHHGHMWVLFGDRHEVVFFYAGTPAMRAIEEHIKKF